MSSHHHYVYHPQGQFKVGAFDVVTPGGKEGVLARIFYPTDAPVNSGHHYTEPQYAKGTVDFMRWGSWAGNLAAWAGNRLRLCCAWAANLLPGNQQLPLIIYSHGLGGNRMLYSSVYVELASHGFIVAAVEHRDGSASMTFSADLGPDGSLQQQWLPYKRHPLSDFEYRNAQVNQRAAECKRLVQLMLQLCNTGTVPHCLSAVPAQLLLQFQKRIDLDRIHIMGHSFGAATALTVAATDTEGIFKSCCAHDPWMHPIDPKLYTKVQMPTLFLHNEKFHWETNVQRMQAVQQHIPEGKCTNLTIRGTNHAAQSDAGLYMWQWLSHKLGLTGALNPQLAIQLTVRVSLRFIDKHEGRELMESDALLLDGHDPACFPHFSFVPDGPAVSA